MAWLEEHTRSQQLASEAEILFALGQAPEAHVAYRAAAEAEERALAYLSWAKPKTVGITLVSAVALYYRALEFDRALKLAYAWLSREGVADFARGQVQDLVQTIWSERARQKSGIEFVGREVLVSMSGGEVAFGAAPLDLVAQKVEQVQRFLYRIAEFVLGKPHRKRGNPEQDILEICRPWILQAPAGSYQFAVRVQVAQQTDFFRTHEAEVREVAAKFLEILGASTAEPPGVLAEMVPDLDYRATFLTMARNLAPDGKSVERVEFKPALGSAEKREVTLVSESREMLSQSLRPLRESRAVAAEHDERITGVLRAVDLELDSLKIADEDTGGVTQVFGAGDTLDDILGPMVNRRVVADTAIAPNGRRRLVDIQPAG